jgi:arginine decarboxylase
VSANFVIPYPPGFPIMVPGQVITRETIDFMRKLDVKEIHGYEAAKGLKLLRPDAIAARAGGGERPSAAADAATARSRRARAMAARSAAAARRPRR